MRFSGGIIILRGIIWWDRPILWNPLAESSGGIIWWDPRVGILGWDPWMGPCIIIGWDPRVGTSGGIHQVGSSIEIFGWDFQVGSPNRIIILGWDLRAGSFDRILEWDPHSSDGIIWWDIRVRSSDEFSTCYLPSYKLDIVSVYTSTRARVNILLLINTRSSLSFKSSQKGSIFIARRFLSTGESNERRLSRWFLFLLSQVRSDQHRAGVHTVSVQQAYTACPYSRRTQRVRTAGVHSVSVQPLFTSTCVRKRIIVQQIIRTERSDISPLTVDCQ